MADNLHILTGAPGTGKTALLRGLRADVRWMAEPARELLAEHPADEVRRVWQRDPDVFVGLLLARSIEKYVSAAADGRTVVFDRGIPDCIAYALHLGADPAASIAAASAYRYNGTALIARPWRDIYTTDQERTMTYEDTVRFHHHVETAYEMSGYALVPVPLMAIVDRVAFIEDMIG